MYKLIIIFLCSSIFAFAQDSKTYRSSYNISVAKDEKNSNFSIGIETSQGIRIWRYFILSANISYHYHTKTKVNILPILGEVKWYLYDLKDDQDFNPYLFLNVGPNLKLGSKFSDGGSANIGMGFNFKIGEQMGNLAIFKTSEGSYYYHKPNIDGYGLKFGITF